MIRSHADVVGSLLRPAELLAAEKKLAAGELQAADFAFVEATKPVAGWRKAATS
jgi:methionine synthase II (cobalamin-independent)